MTQTSKPLTDITNNPELRFLPNQGVGIALSQQHLNIQLAQQLMMDVYGTATNQKWYQYFIIVKKYFSGVYLFEGDNEDITEYQHVILAYLWEYGELVLAKVNGQLEIFYVLKKTYKGLRVHKVKVKSIAFVNEVVEPLTLINGVNCVYFSWDNNNLPAIFFWAEPLHEIVRLEKSFLVTSVWDTKKFIKLVNNNSQEIEDLELQSLIDPTNPVVKLINPTAGVVMDENSTLLNILQPFNTGESKSVITFQNLWNYQKYIFNLYGVIINPPQKKERKLSSEVVQENYWVVNSEDITLQNLKNSFKTWNKVYGENIEVLKKNEIVPEDPENEKKEKQVNNEDA